MQWMTDRGGGTHIRAGRGRRAPSPFLSPVCLLLFVLSAVLCLCASSSGATLQITRPSALQHIGRRSVWVPYGPSQFSGRPYRSTIVWVPSDALCCAEDAADELDLDAGLPKPVTHIGQIGYDEVGGTVVLFNASSECSVLNQLFYAEVVLGATGAVVYCRGQKDFFPPYFSPLLTAPVTHVPAVAVPEEDYETLRAAVVDNSVLVEVVLGWSTSEMLYD
jgi:hypothetical protein